MKMFGHDCLEISSLLDCVVCGGNGGDGPSSINAKGEPSIS